MIDVAYKDSAGLFLLLEMALQAERLISFVQQSLVDRAVWRMARKATLTHGLMLKDKWSALRGVALETRFVLAQKSDAATFELLLDICGRTFHRHSDMRIVAISTTDLAF